MNYTFRQADLNDKQAILDLYNSVKNREYCYWNENYPSLEQIETDIKNNLFVLIVYDRIIGAVSINSANEFDYYDFWQVKDGCCELTRLCVAPNYQGQHYSELMVSKLENIIFERRYRSIHLLVAKGNLPAIKCYKKLNYDFISDCKEFDNEYYACEKSFI